MAKATSPLRVQEELMQDAVVMAKLSHRSAAEQVEYWASIGRRVSNVLTPDNLLSVISGAAKLTVEPVITAPVDPDSVFEALEDDRQAGVLPVLVSGAAVRYQASVSHPGQLERISADGRVTVGQFNGGVFTPVTDQ
ncbi:hypothetical protein FKG94_16915 [Exilibacterium tricleocarpae]|uniref:ParD-like family protein n=1 Tax=Exilibacterium tricleocarpae TaxID=2591008 RepID=A0A545T837_9GAMM|nr:hypothetical protein [Exilibacterium tricleocarpae]TQV73387.1 hypothetical protein FKG94_16915 [Exilibacterium tricleocarpae]